MQTNSWWHRVESSSLIKIEPGPLAIGSTECPTRPTRKSCIALIYSFNLTFHLSFSLSPSIPTPSQFLWKETAGLSYPVVQILQSRICWGAASPWYWWAFPSVTRVSPILLFHQETWSNSPPLHASGFVQICQMCRVQSSSSRDVSSTSSSWNIRNIRLTSYVPSTC